MPTWLEDEVCLISALIKISVCEINISANTRASRDISVVMEFISSDQQPLVRLRRENYVAQVGQRISEGVDLAGKPTFHPHRIYALR